MNEIKTSRIRKNAINYLRTIIWYENISINVSIKRRIAVEINKAFRLGPDPTETENLLFIANANRVSEFFDQQESAIWYKYSLGTTAPNKSTLEICEVKIPESSVYFQHPIWKLLERFPTHEDLKIFYATLPKKNLDFLLKKLEEKQNLLNNCENLSFDQFNIVKETESKQIKPRSRLAL